MCIRDSPESIPACVLADGIAAGMLLVSVDENGPVGFALCRLQAKTLYLDQLSVDPAHGRLGIGRSLIMHVLALAEEHKRSSVTLSTFREVPWNGPYYRKLGFREIPRKKMTDWMFEIEQTQAETLDVTQRYFMQRSLKRFASVGLR